MTERELETINTELVQQAMAEYASAHAIRCVKFCNGDQVAAAEHLQRAAENDVVLAEAIASVGRTWLVQTSTEVLSKGRKANGHGNAHGK